MKSLLRQKPDEIRFGEGETNELPMSRLSFFDILSHTEPGPLPHLKSIRVQCAPSIVSLCCGREAKKPLLRAGGGLV